MYSLYAVAVTSRGSCRLAALALIINGFLALLLGTVTVY